MTREERQQQIESLREKQGITRAHAASIVDAEEAAKNRQKSLEESKS